MLPQSTDLYQSVCVWIVTAAGSVVIAAFAFYFVVVIIRLIKDISRSDSAIASPRPKQADCSIDTAGAVVAYICPGKPNGPCGAPLGPIERVEATDQGAFAYRSCTRCGQQTRHKHTT